MNPKIYLVGGAVRDSILGKEPKDKDYVVVGASPKWMLDQGFTQVGASFPVFLHPVTGDEYALARQERKTGHGYHGFTCDYDPSITLEDDLLRRDLTINAMAMDADGTIIDPYSGQKDLKDRVLRHTSTAFADDPLRVLRLARFAARGFTVHPSTIELAQKLVHAGELENLPKERIWAEIAKGLTETDPSAMIQVLYEVDALYTSQVADYFPQFVICFMSWLQKIFTAPMDLSFETKFLLTIGDIAEEYPDLIEHSKKLCMPTALAKLAIKRKILGDALVSTSPITAEGILTLMESLKYHRTMNDPDTQHAITALQVEEGFVVGKSLLSENLRMVNAAAMFVNDIDMATVVAAGPKSSIKERVREATMDAINRAINAHSMKEET